MKVYAVCDGYHEWHLAPSKIFGSHDKAQAYQKELAEDGCDVTIIEYEVE